MSEIIVTDAESGEEYHFPDGTAAPDIQRAMVMRKMQRSAETAKGNIANYPNAYSGATDKLRQTMPPADQDVSDIRNPAAWKNAAGIMASGAPNAVMETIKGAFQRAKDISGATANQQLAESNIPFSQKLSQGLMNAVEQNPMTGVGLAKAIYGNAKYTGESAGKGDYVGAAIGAGSLLDPLAMGAPSVYENAKKNPGPGSVGYGAPDAAMALSPKIVEALPGKISNPFPNTASAGENFSATMAAAKDVPVDVAKVGDQALEIQSLAKSGGRMPKVVNDFLRRVTDPEQPPLTYEEARKFYTNASRLSSQEYQNLTPVMQRAVGEFTKHLGDSLQGAAEEAGVGKQYRSAMTEYAAAKRWQARGQMLKDFFLQRVVPYGTAAYVANDVINGRGR
jgi:hypothetical protein